MSPRLLKQLLTKGAAPDHSPTTDHPHHTTVAMDPDRTEEKSAASAPGSTPHLISAALRRQGTSGTTDAERVASSSAEEHHEDVSSNPTRTTKQDPAAPQSAKQSLTTAMLDTSLALNRRMPRGTPTAANNRRGSVASSPFSEPLSPGPHPELSCEEEEEQVYQMLRVFFNQYVAFSFVQLAMVLSIVVVDCGSLSGLVTISARGEQWFSQLDVLTLMFFTMEVAVNIMTFGARFFHSFFHKVDFAIVILSDLVYFLIYSSILAVTSQTSVERTEVTMDILRSILRVVRLAVVVVRLNDAFAGPMETLHRRMKAVHRANSKLVG
eukprot:CAMPEP_0178998450 /NCGR_PEP_ID=MMETSP0795-20121207/9518_1 /TAXON_ID=88552 /ORGANISM="Amoebophrya sp., Strain Ameob2" /LENGTH=323 /DNA_ID=CAMNT_0020691127 /DNA_START=448 /DNA_END=1419 /DNA_ORIENTATION=-